MTAFSDRVAVAHLPKTGGHSLRTYLAEHVPGTRDLTSMYMHAPHLALRDWEAWIGRHPDSFERIFAVIRDPYDHQLSQWKFWRDMYARGFRGEQFMHAALYSELTHWLLDPMSDWHVYDPRRLNGTRNLQRTVAPPDAGYEHFGGYYAYWLQVDGKVPDNVTLLRFETMGRDFPRALSEYLGKPLPDTMPHENKGPGADEVRPYYSPEAVQIVNSKFRWAFRKGLFMQW